MPHFAEVDDPAPDARDRPGRRLRPVDVGPPTFDVGLSHRPFSVGRKPNPYAAIFVLSFEFSVLGSLPPSAEIASSSLIVPGVLMRGFQDVSREWLELTQERLRKNAEGMTKLAQCRTLPDFAAVQSDLARDNLNQIIDVTGRIAERSMKVADEAAKTITAETGKGRYSQAA